MQADPPSLTIKLQIHCGADIAMGPGKADLLDAIDREGSISAAGRKLGMSYRRSWMLVEVMNRCWHAPLVEASAGGRSGGGARITDAGRQVLSLYRALQKYADGAGGCPEWTRLQEMLSSTPGA